MTKEDRSNEVASILKDLESALEGLQSKRTALECLRSSFPGYYILNGREIVAVPNLLEWALWMERTNRHVGEDFIADFRVSTIFLGLDHNFFKSARPILFETMVFGPAVEYKDFKGKTRLMSEALDYQIRYHTYDEAEQGHALMCDEIGKLLESSDTIVTNAVLKAALKAKK